MFRKINGILFIALLLGLTSCESYFGNINENPNSPTDASVDVMLTAIGVEVADIYGGDFSRFASILTQHAEGVARQWSSTNNYSGYVPANFNTAWVNSYANILNEALILKQKSADAGFAHYEGVANVLTAFHLMNATDVWGDMPYSTALKGIDNIASPATFDSQESIYNEVFALLNAAITLFGQDGGASVPGGDDVIYGGDIALWTKAAYAIQARAYLHLGLVDNANYGNALTAAGNAFASAAEEMTMQYTTAAQGQWYRFNDGRTGDIEFHPTYTGIMAAMADTFRHNLLAQTFNTGHPYFVAAYNQPMITYREMKFLQAECLMMTGGSAADIHAAWVDGVNAAFDHFGLSGNAAEFLANNDPGEGNVTMEHIQVQKNIALYGTLEPYNDWRRTALPALSPNDNVAIPIRFPYGDSEYSFNPNTPQVDVQTDNVWWDR